MISHAHPQQLALATSICRGVVLDNGAFSAWKAGRDTDWPAYYEWTDLWLKHPTVEWAIIPDAITGSDEDNDALLKEWPHGKYSGVPVWHMHERLERLERLASDYPRIALGSSGEYAEVGALGWWDRMGRAMSVVCNREGHPLVKLHGLRMMRREVLTVFPFASVDSTNIARSIGIDQRWRGTYQPPSKASRARLMADKIESHRSPAAYRPLALQEILPILGMEA